MSGSPFAGRDQVKLYSPSPIVDCQIDLVVSPAPWLRDPAAWPRFVFCEPQPPAFAARQSRSPSNRLMASVCALVHYRPRCADDVQASVLAREPVHSASQCDRGEDPELSTGHSRLESHPVFHHSRPSHTPTWEFRLRVLVL